MKRKKEQPKEFQKWLKESRSRFPRWMLWVEWQSERLSCSLSRWAFLEVLEHLGKLSLLVAVVLWIYPGYMQRKQVTESAKAAAADARKSRQYVAWQTINSAIGKPGDAGRANALEDLSRDGVSMKGISLVGHAVLLGPLEITNAKMAHADFSDAEFKEINFSGSEFMSSKWDNASALGCNFKGCSFWSVTFRNATFSGCDFGVFRTSNYQQPTVFLAIFENDQRSRFTMCDFTAADIPMGIWNSVSFSWCNFANANIGLPYPGTNSTIEYCNLFGAKTSSPDFIKWAFHQQVVFTNVTSLEKWNHCVTNGLKYEAGSPEFISWASNQYNTYIQTNNPQGWLEWSRDNLKK